jgi:hypothetical protein
VGNGLGSIPGVVFSGLYLLVQYGVHSGPHYTLLFLHRYHQKFFDLTYFTKSTVVPEEGNIGKVFTLQVMDYNLLHYKHDINIALCFQIN